MAINYTFAGEGMKVEQKQRERERIRQAIAKFLKEKEDGGFFGRITVIMQDGNIEHIQTLEDQPPVKLADAYCPRKLIIVRRDKKTTEEMDLEELAKPEGEENGKQDKDTLDRGNVESGNGMHED